VESLELLAPVVHPALYAGEPPPEGVTRA